MTKRELKKLFRDYPDLVRLPELCAMMGGIGDSTARKLLREGHIRSIMVRSTYYIPKTCISSKESVGVVRLCVQERMKSRFCPLFPL